MERKNDSPIKRVLKGHYPLLVSTLILLVVLIGFYAAGPPLKVTLWWQIITEYLGGTILMAGANIIQILTIVKLRETRSFSAISIIVVFLLVYGW